MARDDAPVRRLSIDDLQPDVRDVQVIDWPGTDRKVGLLLLRVSELQEAHFAAREHFKRKAATVDWASKVSLDEEEALQQVYRMLIDPDAKAPEYRVFKSPEQARARLTPDQRDHFVGEHMRAQAEIAKSWAPLPEDDGGEG